MYKLILNERIIRAYKNHLMEDEKSPLTIEKYLRDVKALFTWKNPKK